MAPVSVTSLRFYLPIDLFDLPFSGPARISSGAFVILREYYYGQECEDGEEGYEGSGDAEGEQMYLVW